MGIGRWVGEVGIGRWVGGVGLIVLGTVFVEIFVAMR